MQTQRALRGEPMPLRPDLFRRLGRLLDEGNQPLFKLLSWASQLRVDPRAMTMPGMELFYSAMSEMIYARYGLKGTVQRAMMGEPDRPVHDSLALGVMNVNRMAEQAGWILQHIKQGAAPALVPLVETMERLFQEERVNFKLVMNLVQTIMGPDGEPARQRVMGALSFRLD